jgi:hypothetical protein
MRKDFIFHFHFHFYYYYKVISSESTMKRVKKKKASDFNTK